MANSTDKSMIVRFVLDPDIYGAGPHELGMHRRILAQWRSFGVRAIGPTAPEISDLIRQLPQKIMMLYREHLKHNYLTSFRVTADIVGLETVETREQLRAYKNIAEVACVDETRACVLGLADDEISLTDPDMPEVVPLKSFDLAEAVVAAKTISQQSIEKGERLSQIWNQRFETLAKYCRKVVVADRYGASDLAENNRIASQKRDWFLNQLDRCGSQVRVTLLVGDNKQKNSGQPIADKICSQFSSHRGGVKSLEVFVSPDFLWQGYSEGANGGSHGRFIRFDDRVLQIDTGLELFEHEKIQRNTQFTLVELQRIHRNIQRVLSSKCREYEEVIGYAKWPS